MKDLRTRVQRGKKFLYMSGLTMVLMAQPIAAQGPWGKFAKIMADDFTGPIARGLALVAVVIGGLQIAFGESGGMRIVGGLFFGLGLSLAATQFLAWLF